MSDATATNVAPLETTELATVRQLIRELRSNLDARNPAMATSVEKVKKQLNLFPSTVFALTKDEIRDICAGVLTITSTTLAASDKKEEKATERKALKSLASSNPDDVL